jgi:hypothetical protein
LKSGLAPTERGSTTIPWLLFPIPKKQMETLTKEIQKLCNLGVLKWQADSEWASPTFIIPKKDNTIQVVSDFREINKRIVRKHFPIPKPALFYKNSNALHMPQPLI